jgi:hypothetical protein
MWQMRLLNRLAVVSIPASSKLSSLPRIFPLLFVALARSLRNELCRIPQSSTTVSTGASPFLYASTSSTNVSMYDRQIWFDRRNSGSPFSKAAQWASDQQEGHVVEGVPQRPGKLEGEAMKERLQVDSGPVSSFMSGFLRPSTLYLYRELLTTNVLCATWKKRVVYFSAM